MHVFLVRKGDLNLRKLGSLKPLCNEPVNIPAQNEKGGGKKNKLHLEIHAAVPNNRTMQNLHMKALFMSW